MQTLMHNNLHKPNTQNISLGLEITTYLLCFITLIVALLDNNLSMKLYSITAILSLFALISRGKPKNYNMQYWLLSLAVLIIGITNLIWYSAFKVDNSPFRSTYHNYLNTAKIFIMGAFLVLLVLSSKIKIKREVPLYIMYTLSFIIAGYAFYIKSTTGAIRIDFGIGTATGAAYSIMFVGITSAVSVLYTKRNHPVFFILNIIAVFYALALTQTRSSLLLLPIISALSLALFYMKSPKKLFFSAIGFLILMTTLIIVFSKPLYDRYHEAVVDLNLYSNDNSNSSLGARFAMYEIGFDILREDPFVMRSAESRAQLMTERAEKQTYLSGALEYSNIHLHNEIIESASLKGVAGVISTIFLYIALFYTVYKYKSLGLFAFTLAIIGTGLSDVIIWARSIPIIMICAIVLLLFIKKIKIEDTNLVD
ncbi:O-antigen ligase family protein [Escherichia coli]|nr:O-antigen ligase family protein [Escherichia coli]